MKHTITLALATAALSAPSLAQAPCVTEGHCTFTPWVPEDLSTGSKLGSDVDLSGDTAALGAWGKNAVFLYERQGAGWVEVDRIQGELSSGFGWSLDLEGERMVIGAPLVGDDVGRVHVYERIDGTWNEVQVLEPTSPQTEGDFGRDVALWGDWIAVGQAGHGQGSVDLFHRVGGRYQPEPGLLPVGAAEQFGHSLDISQGRLVVGDPLDDAQGLNAGAVYSFDLAPGATFLRQKFSPPTVGSIDFFGWSVALKGERLVVGAHGDDTVGVNSGSAYVFAHVDVPWPQFEEIDQLFPCDPQGHEKFGWSVSLSKGRAAIGAPSQGALGPHGGRVHVFRQQQLFGEQWVPEARILPPSIQVDDEFGFEVALRGDHVLGGAPNVDTEGSNAGAAFFASLASSNQPGGLCPCDSMAMVRSFGTPVPGTLGDPILELAAPPILGDSVLVRLRNVAAGSQPWLYLAPAAPGTTFDPRRPLVPGSTFLPFPTVTAFQQVGLGWDIPADLALCGTTWQLLAFFQDAAAPAPLHMAVSNELRATLGY